MKLLLQIALLSPVFAVKTRLIVKAPDLPRCWMFETKNETSKSHIRENYWVKCQVLLVRMCMFSFFYGEAFEF